MPVTAPRGWEARADLPASRQVAKDTGTSGAAGLYRGHRAPLPVDRITQALPKLVARCNPKGFAEVAEAILTTDTRPKTSRLQGED